MLDVKNIGGGKNTRGLGGNVLMSKIKPIVDMCNYSRLASHRQVLTETTSSFIH
jgi:hypothetical protein